MRYFIYEIARTNRIALIATKEAIIHSNITDTTMSNSNSAASVHKQDGKQKRAKKTELQEESEGYRSSGDLTTECQSQDPPREVVPYGESEVACREEAPPTAYENGVCQSPHHPRWWLPSIRKDDEFFHFVILCFAAGTLLVCYYKYKDWTVSLGIGLMTFAALETTGIYFGLVYRIRSILEGFIPLLQRVKMPGLRKVN
ncbi:transmembrane protein 40 isoform X2 [Rhineura floridana]|uniref:transmembrane protein 40 isoform X2 n=1 Tax=Rhineura floridana TaxID=261503 RepID=UPI002AC84C31|nr:transmembrane protein 40 isoform X2 [Rhineura floridana]